MRPFSLTLASGVLALTTLTQALALAAAPASHPADTTRADTTRATTGYTKVVERVLPLSPTGRLALDHRYGDIAYHTWSKPEVRVVITITVESANAQRAQETFDAIDFDFQSAPETAAIKTLVANRQSSGTWTWLAVAGGSSARAFEIDYEVWAPAGATLELEHRYGDVRLPNLAGSAHLRLAYGDLAGADIAGVSRLEVSYGNARLGHVPSLDAKVRYGSLALGGATLLALDSRYSELKLGRIGTLDLACGYDDIAVRSVRTLANSGDYTDLRIDSASSVRMGGSYSDMHLGYLGEVATFKLTYGDVVIASSSPNLRTVEFDGTYADLALHLARGQEFEVDARTSYGDLVVPAGVTKTSEVSRSSAQVIVGHTGGQPRTAIVFRGSYSDLLVR